MNALDAHFGLFKTDLFWTMPLWQMIENSESVLPFPA
jgi:hypothetical protein